MQTVREKFDDIAEDLTYNVTKIYGRKDIIITADLVFHSVLGFKFMGEYVQKGWTEACIIGDTRSGKSKTLEELVAHYKAGEIIIGEDLSYAGLIGGLQQINKRWFITWGKLVLLNRRLAVIDEVNNLDVKDIASMSGIRSRGIAEITKIQQSRAEARTRQIWLGNPRSNRFLDTYAHGIVALKELIGKLDDIARFDLGIACAETEVPETTYNNPHHKSVPHRYTSELCHNLIMWAWSRKRDQVKFIEGAEDAILERSSDLSKKYTSQIPLVNRSEMRIKLARLSVAAAARVFSTDETFEVVVVTPEHVEFVHDFLVECYDKPTMSYDIYTKIKEGELKLEHEKEVFDYVVKKGKDFMDGFLNYEYLALGDIQDFTEEDRDGSKKIISHLVKQKCLKKYHTQYIKTPAFNGLLRRMKLDHNKGTLKFDGPAKHLEFDAFE